MKYARGIDVAAIGVGGLAVSVGWVGVAQSIAGNAPSGIFWMTALAVAATAGLAGFLLRRSVRPMQATACYALVALAPTTFAYPSNLLVIVIAVLFAVSQTMRRRTLRRPAV